MEKEISKTYYDLFVILIPIVSSMVFFFFGKLWERRTIQDSNKFTLERDRIARKRDKTLEFYEKVIEEIHLYLDSLMNYIIHIGIFDEIDSNPGFGDAEIEGAQDNLDKAFEKYENLIDSVYRVKIHLTLIGLHELRKELDNFTAKFTTVHTEYFKNPSNYELNPEIKRLQLKRQQILEVVTNRFDEFWEESENT